MIMFTGRVVGIEVGTANGEGTEAVAIIDVEYTASDRDGDFISRRQLRVPLQAAFASMVDDPKSVNSKFIGGKVEVIVHHNHNRKS